MNCTAVIKGMADAEEADAADVEAVMVPATLLEMAALTDAATAVVTAVCTLEVMNAC